MIYYTTGPGFPSEKIRLAQISSASMVITTEVGRFIAEQLVRPAQQRSVQCIVNSSGVGEMR